MNGHPDAVRLLGVDVGGTKTHLASIDHGGRRRDVVRASSDWRRGHLFSDDQNLPRLGAWIASLSHLGQDTQVVIGLRDCDSDAEIEQAAGCSINEIFARFGEAAFRDGERKVIARLLAMPPHVLATGGGAFADDETRARIKADAVSVWINVPLEVLIARVGRRDTRPMLKDGDPAQIMASLLEQREPLYALADLTVNSEDGPHQMAVERIVAMLKDRELLEAA